MEFIGAFVHLLSFYPFTWDQTILLGGMVTMAFNALMSRNWKKVQEIIVTQATPLVLEALDNETKRDLVVKAVWQKMPATLRAFATPDQVEKMVDQVYVNVVKPEARRKGLLNQADINQIAVTESKAAEK